MQDSKVGIMQDGPGSAERRARFGDWLAAKRGGLPLQIAARRVGLSVYVYRSIELGYRHNISIEELDRIADAHRISRSEVLDRAREAGF